MLDYEEITKEKDLFNIFGSESKIFSDNLYVYKIFKNLNRLYLQNKFNKVNILSTLKDMSEAVIPIDNIMDVNSRFRGYSMEKLNGITLEEYFNLVDDDAPLLGVIDASKKLHNIHKRSENIIIGDLNFTNIMLKSDKDGLYTDSIFIDLDNASVDGLKYNRFSGVLARFYKPRLKSMRINKNSDRLTLLLYMLLKIFDTASSIYAIDMYDFDKKSETLTSLYNIRKLLMKLKDQAEKVPEIPYIYEIFNASDIRDLKLIRK